jgi:hypothetical protein
MVSFKVWVTKLFGRAKRRPKLWHPNHVHSLSACVNRGARCLHWIGFLGRVPLFDLGRPQDSIVNSSRSMTEINAFGTTYVGTAEGDHGVFTDSSDGDVYEGQIAGGSACVGVATRTDGTTYFAECDADGKVHGRWLYCYAGGHTRYRLCEHGSRKEHAALFANGTCVYNDKACRADYAPFVALQAMVLPIKARPPLVAPQPPLCRIFSLPSPPDRSNRPLFWHAQELAKTHADKVRAQPTPPSVACTARATQPTAPAKQTHRASNRDDAPGRRCTTHATQATCIVHPSAVPCPPCSAVDPRAPPPL